VLTSLFGDVFLQDAQGYWFLDSLEGTLNRVAGTRDEIQAILDSEDGQDQYLMGGLAFGADGRGIHLKPPEVYAFKVAPILGGTMDVDSIVVMDFIVSLDIAGQLHRQLREMPPGTHISAVQLQP